MKMTRAEIDKIQGKTRAEIDKLQNPPPAPQPLPPPQVIIVPEKSGEAIKAASNEMRYLADHIVEAVNRRTHPIAYRFDVKRDRRGFIETVIATPMDGEE